MALLETTRLISEPILNVKPAPPAPDLHRGQVDSWARSRVDEVVALPKLVGV